MIIKCGVCNQHFDSERFEGHCCVPTLPSPTEAVLKVIVNVGRKDGVFEGIECINIGMRIGTKGSVLSQGVAEELFGPMQDGETATFEIEVRRIP